MRNTALVVQYTKDEKSGAFSQSIGQRVVEGSFLEFCYKEIECQTVEVVEVFKGVDFWVDEEGLMWSGNPIVSYRFFRTLAGNIVITKGIDQEGNTLLFDPEDDYDRKIMASISRKLSQWTIAGVTE